MCLASCFFATPAGADAAMAILAAGKLWLLGEDLQAVEHMDDRGDESLQLSIVKTIKGATCSSSLAWPRLLHTAYAGLC